MLIASTLLALVTLGCAERKKEPAKPPPKRTMPVRPGAAMNLDKPDRVRVQTDLIQARAAIQMHQQTSEGANPKSVEEIGVRFNFPKDIMYDSNSGEIKSKTYPSL